MLIDLHSDNETLGSGRRLCVIYNRRGSKISVMDCFSFRRAVLSTANLRQCRDHGLTPYQVRRLAKRMDERRKLFKRLGVSFDEKAAKAAIKAIRETVSKGVDTDSA